MKAQILPVDLNLWCLCDIVGKVRKFSKYWTFFFFNQACYGASVLAYGIYTDGAASMTGIHSGVVGHVKKVAPNITATHGIIHREALVAKKWMLLCPKSCHL